MFLNAKNNSIKIKDTTMDYISFGKGAKNLIMFPGLGDGLSTVKGTAIPCSILYKLYSNEYKVYIFSRKNQLHEGYSTKDMARDQAEAMKILGIKKADIIGVSQGGMIAQYFAIDYPQLVNKLVLAVTLSKQNETVQEIVNNWITMIKLNDYKKLLIDTAEKSYTKSYLKKHRFFYTFLGTLGKPKDFSRFIIQAISCMQHNAYDELDKIKCPTLIIGGACDKIVGSHSSNEMAEKIGNSKLFIYDNLGHAAPEEAKDFNTRVLDFLKTNA